MSKAPFSEQELSIFEVALRASNQGFVVWDADQNLVAWSNKCPDFWYQPEGMLRIGMPMLELLIHIARHGGLGPGAPEQLAANELARVKAAGSDSIDEFKMLDGRTIRVQRNSMPEGGHASTYTDITAQKQYETSLQTAARLAKEANNAKSQFLASMSHDLRTPLNAILGYSDMIRCQTFGPLENEIYREYIDDIFNSGSLLLSLINDVLDISKIESQDYQLSEKPIDIISAVSASKRQLENMARESGVEIKVRIPDGIAPLVADERALIQMLNNLLSNGIKFTPEHGKVDITATEDENGAISISVSDTGIGMTEEELARALQPFEQIDPGKVRGQKGTGLGLTICTKLMRLHNGELRIESNPGEGTDAKLCFPPERGLSH